MPTILDKWLAKKKPTKLTPLKAIRARCLDCCGNNQAEVRHCVVWACPIWPYRMARRGIPPPSWRHPDDDKLPEDIPEELDEDDEGGPLDDES